MSQPTETTGAIWFQLSGSLWRFLRRRVADDHTADDLLQDVFVRIHSGISALEDVERLPAWVYQIARNVVTDHYRRKRPEPLESPESLDAPAADEWRKLVVAAESWLAEMVGRLPERYREVVRMADMERLPHQQVAQRLGISLSATKSRVRRGRVLLKRALDACCRFERDRRGNFVGCQPLPNRRVCADCEDT